MNTPWNIIKELESDNSRLFKEHVIEREVNECNTIFFEGCKLALDSLITFGIKKIDTKQTTDGDGLSWEEFIDAISTLRDRTVTGNAAKQLVQELQDTATQDQWNYWYRRILIKDLRCGVSDKTINKKTKNNEEYKIPVFACQLAQDSANHESKVSGVKILEVKLDGQRVLTVVYPDGTVDQYSRNGNELVNFTVIKQQFSEVAHALTKPLVFDGEIMGTTFQELMKQSRRKTNVQADDSVLNLFDVIPLEDFITGKCNTTQSSRSAYLKLWYSENSASMKNICLVDQETVDLDTTEGMQRYYEINKTAIDNGFEGIMLKDPTAPYEAKKGTHWLKLKPFIEVTLSITGFNPGTGRNSNSLGALVCQGIDDGKEIYVDVGGGFSDNQRTEFWADRNRLLGHMVEVRADAITQNQNGTYSLRFPRFKCFRGFKKGEKM